MLFNLGSSSSRPLSLPTLEEAIPDRAEPALFNPEHFVHGRRTDEPLPDGLQRAVFGPGYYWGAERHIC